MRPVIDVLCVKISSLPDLAGIQASDPRHRSRFDDKSHQMEGKPSDMAGAVGGVFFFTFAVKITILEILIFL
jgi:hypothetical protein